MLFCVMYAVFAKFLRMSDGTPTYPVVLLMGISAWQFVQESTSVGLRAIVDRGDLLRKIHFPNYIVVVSSTIGALISFAINFVVVLLFALFTHVHFTACVTVASQLHSAVHHCTRARVAVVDHVCVFP